MIEGASIDKQLHVMDWQRAAYDTIEFDKAIEYAEKWNKEHGNDTLIIVLADHAHGVSISGTYHEHDGKKARKPFGYTRTPYSPPSKTRIRMGSRIIRIRMLPWLCSTPTILNTTPTTTL